MLCVLSSLHTLTSGGQKHFICCHKHTPAEIKATTQKLLYLALEVIINGLLDHNLFLLESSKTSDDWYKCWLCCLEMKLKTFVLRTNHARHDYDDLKATVHL